MTTTTSMSTIMGRRTARSVLRETRCAGVCGTRAASMARGMSGAGRGRKGARRGLQGCCHTPAAVKVLQ